MCLHERGVFARFRYNDLKEAARDLRRTRPYANSMVGKSGVELCRGCAAERTRDCRRPEAGRMRKRIVSSMVEELEKGVRSEGRHRGTERVEKHFRIGESRFMPQP
jgi:hypothetical protein